MEKNRKKIDELTKAKLIYTIELVAFSIIFLVIGILNIIGVIVLKDWRITVVLYLTAIGGFIGLGDLIWVILSKKRRAKNSLLDKILIVPAGLFLSPLSIYQLATGTASFLPWQIGSALCYFSLVYIVEAIYHWEHPVPGLLEEDKKEENAEAGIDASTHEEEPSKIEKPEESKDEEKEN